MANCYFAKPDGMQHCYIPFLYVIDFKGALSFDEAQEFLRTTGLAGRIWPRKVTVEAGAKIGLGNQAE